MLLNHLVIMAILTRSAPVEQFVVTKDFQAGFVAKSFPDCLTVSIPYTENAKPRLLNFEVNVFDAQKMKVNVTMIQLFENALYKGSAENSHTYKTNSATAGNIYQVCLFNHGSRNVTVGVKHS